MLLLFVDDMITTNNNKIEISKFHDDLSLQFKMKVLEELTSYEKKNEIFGNNKSKKVSTSLNVNIKLSYNDIKVFLTLILFVFLLIVLST